MKRENLIELVSQKLGVSVSEKNFAFDIFLQRVAHALNYEQAIEFSEIGIFFPKKKHVVDSASESESRENYKDFLIYIPGRKGETEYPDSMYLAFDVPVKKKSAYEFDENVFSLGIGKPIIPITKQEVAESAGSETSRIILRKAIENRVDEIISTGKIIKDFSFWDDLLGKSKTEVKKDSLNQDEFGSDQDKIHLEENELISDEDLKNDLQKSGDELFDKDLETLDSLLNDVGEKDITENKDPNSDKSRDESESHMEWDWGDQLRQEFLEDSDNVATSGEDILEDDNESGETGYEDELFDRLEESLKEKKVDEFLSTEPEDESESTELIENQSPVEENQMLTEDLESPTEETSDLIDEKDEFPAEEISDLIEDNSENLTEETEGKTEELQDELNEIKETEYPEDIDTNEEQTIEPDLPSELEDSEVESNGSELINEKIPLSDSMEIKGESEESTDEIKSGAGMEPPKNTIQQIKEKIFDLGKGFWITLLAFIIITIVGIIYLFNDEPVDTSLETALVDSSAAKVLNDSTTSGNLLANDTPELTREDTSGRISEALDNVDEVISTPDQIKKEIESEPERIPSAVAGDLYRNSDTEQQIKSTLYFDGEKYNFQVSSWKNKEKAENETKRLRKLGFEAFIIEAYLKNLGGTWYRVRIGFFDSESEITEFRKKNNI